MKIANIVTVLVTFIVTANVHGYVGTMGFGIYQLHFYVAIFALCSIVPLRKHATLFTQPQEMVYYLLWCTGFVFSCLLSIFLVNSEAYAFEQFIAYCWMIIVSTIYALHCLKVRNALYFASVGMFLATMLLSAVTFLEFLDPEFRAVAQVSTNIEEQKVTGNASRIGGLWINANENGNALVFGMFASLAILPRVLKLPYVIMIGLAVLATVSRSSIVMWIIALILLYALGDFGRRSVSRFLSTMSIVVLGVFLINSGKIPDIVDHFDMGEFLSENMRDRLSGNFFSQDDGSTDERTHVAVRALSGFATKPLLGYGLGSSRGTGLEYGSDVGTHNMFLQVALEQGVVGLAAVFLGLLVLIYKCNSMRAFAFFLLFSLANLFSHTLLNQPYIGILIVMTAVLYPISIRLAKQGKSKRRKRRRRKTSTEEGHRVAPIRRKRFARR